MRHSIGRIHTRHAGSLPRPNDLIELNRARMAAGFDKEAGFQERLRAAVAEVVARQHELRLDVPGDGEYGKAMGRRVGLTAAVEVTVHTAEG